LIGTDFSNYFTEPEQARTGYKGVDEEFCIRLACRNKKKEN
jgi:hypothetical protein